MRRVLATALAAAVLSGCGHGLYDFPTEPNTDVPCRELVDDLPEFVANEDQTPVDSERVAAWGDPRIELRCGVTRPKALTPTSTCDEVDGVGWLTEKLDDGFHRFTTIGRTPYVSVTVPSTIDPAGAVLVDLAPAVSAHTDVTSPCQ